MDAMKLLIADGNEEFRRALAAELQGAYHGPVLRRRERGAVASAFLCP